MEASRSRRRGHQRVKAIVEEDEDDYQEADDGAVYEEDGMSPTIIVCAARNSTF